MNERVVLGETYQYAKTVNPLGLLGMRGERPSRRPGEGTDDGTSSYRSDPEEHVLPERP